MGICISHESIPVPTAKLIHENGQLQEFSYPVSVSKILQRNSNYFICKADDINYDDYITAIHGDEELQLDQLYFALPLCWLKRPLTARQMAALAVKASLALNADGGRRRRSRREIRRVDPLLSISDNFNETQVGGGRGGSRTVAVKRKWRSGGRKSKFSPKLSVITEE